MSHAKRISLVALLSSVIGCSGADLSQDSSEESSAGESGGPASGSSSGGASGDGEAPVGGTSSTGAPTRPDEPAPVCDAELIDGRLVHGDASPLVQVDPGCGKLSYGRYANQGQESRAHLVPDFSFAGYQGGGVALPDVPTSVSLAPQSGDQRARIQAAIDQVSDLEPDENGIRGAVTLEAGTFEISDTLSIRQSGVVLRGAGPDTDGTVIVATRREQHDIIELQGQGSGAGEVSGSRVSVDADLVPVGAHRIPVEDASGFTAGDTVYLRRTPNDAWIDDLDMGQWGWTADSYQTNAERVVDRVEGNVVILKAPVVDAIEQKYGGGVLFKVDLSGRIEKSGVEDLRLVAETNGDPEDEDHAWNGVKFARATNSWVKRVAAVHMGYAAVTFVSESSFNTVEDVAYLDPVSLVSGGRRYSFNVSGGTGNLFQRCFSEAGRHTFVTGSRVVGPHVWVDSVGEDGGTDGPHHRWATGLLFDSIVTNTFRVENRKASGSGHGWAGAQTMLWNLTAWKDAGVDAPFSAMNWAVGVVGTKVDSHRSPEEPDGLWESEGSYVTPRSLYYKQLEDRLGAEALEAVTTEAQRSGSIDALLRAWGDSLRD